MSVADRVRELVLPLLDDRKLDLYDVELQGPVLRLVVDAPGREGLDLDVLADATRAVSRALDEADPIAGQYTLEVTSPGLERTLRRPEHFERAVGETVKIRTTGADAGGGTASSDDRRLEGELIAAGPDGVTVRTGYAENGTPTERRLAYDVIERARTVFEWGSAPRPGGKRKSDEKRERRQ